MHRLISFLLNTIENTSYTIYIVSYLRRLKCICAFAIAFVFVSKCKYFEITLPLPILCI